MGRFALSPKIAIPLFAIVHTANRSLRDTAFRWTRCETTYVITRGPPTSGGTGGTCGSFVKNLAGTTTIQICAPHATIGSTDALLGTRQVIRLASQIHATRATRTLAALPFLARPAPFQATVLVVRLVSRAYASFRQHRARWWLVSSFVRVSPKGNMSRRGSKRFCGLIESPVESAVLSKVPRSRWPC